MRLNRKFSIIAAVAALQMAVLIFCTIVGVNFIQNLRDYQYLQQSVQLGLADITNYLNTTVSWAIEPDAIHDNWKSKIVTLNKKFHELEDDPVCRFFSDGLSGKITEALSVWTRVVSKINPFNAQYKNMQDVQLPQEIADFVRRNGIQAAAENYPDSEEIQDVYSQQLLIHTQMRDIMKEETALALVMADVNEMLLNLVARYSLYFNGALILLSLVFCAILFIFILHSTSKITIDIRDVRDFSSALARKDFTTEITPHGSNEMQALMNNMNGMVSEINDFFIIVKKTAARAISSGYSINDSAISTTAATTQINGSIKSITREFEQINDSVARAVVAVDEINSHIKTLVEDNTENTAAIDESSAAISAMSGTLIKIRESAEARSRSAEEMRSLVADGDEKINATTMVLENVMSQLDEIGEVITIINAVAEQTNLLSMNAAIESAHAGEYGKGFAVVAEEIRKLAEETADNALKINEAITKVIAKVTEANESSRAASGAFSRVSTRSREVIDSFDEITKGIEALDNQTRQVTHKTDITASSAAKIHGYCTNLAEHQETVASEITSISLLFNEAVADIQEIQTGTEDIVKRMTDVGTLSKESYKNMTDLENVLEQFKTTSDDSEEVRQEIDSSAIQNVISPELQAQLEQDFGGDAVEFDPDGVI
ncbi:MAG: hypothetical protein K2H09_06000 [Treponemataceae bacterium]|nr:hypothetical protein [Treponemataceae bacterium]